MLNFRKVALAILAASFCASTPVIAAETAPTPPAVAKPDLAGALKEKAASAMEKGQQKVDSAAQNLKKSLGMPDKNATQPATETLEVNQESVTVETPQGEATETTTTVTPVTPPATPTPETPAAPSK